MRRGGGIAMLLVLSMLLTSCAGKQEASERGSVSESAARFVKMLVGGESAAAWDTFDPTMRAAMPRETLAQVWQGLTQQMGAFRGQKGVRVAREMGLDAAYVTCEFEKAAVDIKVVYNDRGLVSGLWITPVEQAREPVYTAPAYVKADSFDEKEVTVGSGDWALPGTLSMPRGKGPFPAIALVHGSGPQDRDETIGPNKPFRDIAWGLASRGIAVLRYEKRTREHAAKMLNAPDRVTVKEETVDDAAAAATLLLGTRSIDPGRVFVLGHSLGGMLAPRVAQAAPRIAGLIVLAGTTRPLEDVIVGQLAYIFSADGPPSDDEQRQLEQIRKEAARVKDPNLSAAAREPILMVPSGYWLDLRDYDPPALAAKLGKPMLILQGGRDYQVTEADLEGWKKRLSAAGGVEIKLYPKLNHLFMEGEGKITPSEYEKPGHVAPEVIDDIARWIGTLRSGKPVR